MLVIIKRIRYKTVEEVVYESEVALIMCVLFSKCVFVDKMTSDTYAVEVEKSGAAGSSEQKALESLEKHAVFRCKLMFFKQLPRCYE